MELPALLPPEFTLYAQAETDEDLLRLLIKRPSDLIPFLECASSDETWSESHLSCLQGALKWLTLQFRHEKLALPLAQRISRVVQSHYPVWRDAVTRDVTIKCADGAIEANALLLGVSSDFFFQLIRAHYQEEEVTLNISNVTSESMALLEEYANSGDIVGLWKREPSFILALLQHAASFQMEGAMALCQVTFNRYINRDNAVDMLEKAHIESWDLLKKGCFDYLNKQRLGIKFEEVESDFCSEGEKRLALEFLEFSDSALVLFARLKEHVTNLICGGSLTEEAPFSSVVKECPNLRYVDISRSRAFSQRLFDLNADLSELNVSMCPWLTHDYLKQLIEICPHLKRLVLRSNTQLTYHAWGELQKLKCLKRLDLSRCSQIRDSDLLLITRACPHIIELRLEECIGLSEGAFYEIAHSLPYLVSLNVARCAIADAQLIEIAVRCRNLRVLDISRCKSVSDKGIQQVIKQAPHLQIFSL